MVELEVPYAYVKCIWKVPWVLSFTLIKLSVSTILFCLFNKKNLRNFSYSIVILENLATFSAIFFGQIFEVTKLKRKSYSGEISPMSFV
jgi:hypothetical protein